MHSEPQKMDFQHQLFTKKLKFDTKKGVFQHQIFLFRAPASRCTKNGQTQVAPVVHHPPPKHQKLAKRFKPARGLAIYFVISFLFQLLHPVRLPPPFVSSRSFRYTSFLELTLVSNLTSASFTSSFPFTFVATLLNPVRYLPSLSFQLFASVPCTSFLLF